MNFLSYWQCGRFQIDLSTPKIMGIVNLTPDSFSDGGRYSTSLQAALAHAQRLCDEGAAILDIGGESTRPGAAAVSPPEEWARVAPVLEVLHGWGVPITLDTRRTEIMAKALAAGWVDGINDVAALEDAGALDLLAQYPQTGVCLMHMQGLPETMQQQADYADVVAEVGAYLQQRVQYCVAAGIAAERLLADPGFGFGKNLAHNTALMQQLRRCAQASGRPLLVGVSRKRMIGELGGENEAANRVAGSVVAAVAAVARGAAIVRVHDVAATRQGLQVWAALGGHLP